MKTLQQILKKTEKTCGNCYHCFELSKQKYCGINGLETKDTNYCSQHKINHARNMYSLCSSSECLDCQYFIKEFHFCNIGGKINETKEK